MVTKTDEEEKNPTGFKAHELFFSEFIFLLQFA